MKKLFLILTGVVLLTSCAQIEEKYRIETPDGTYYVNSYEQKDCCISFYVEVSSDNSSQENHTVCGSYEIITNN